MNTCNLHEGFNISDTEMRSSPSLSSDGSGEAAFVVVISSDEEAGSIKSLKEE